MASQIISLVLIAGVLASSTSAARIASEPFPTPTESDAPTTTTTTTIAITQSPTPTPCPPPGPIPCPPFPYCGTDGSYTHTITMIGTRCETCAACAPVSATRGVPIPAPGTTLGAGCTPPPSQGGDYPGIVICPSGQTTARTWTVTSFWPPESKTSWCKLAGCFDYEPTPTPEL
ncbi:hypothetical protein CC1G_04912 [Coprinopsis cinerea okayama7|uniref:Uncharacterized protein n=1 Tax=Coprinopsis cinerea (strain Okayama-7 / 130 / ATCC MYA-4618 / FGSC 9003) TaxID=240176 RepID=A8PFI1_COPC7|nr:hypothetical protein CC1G_04912 [Coprinopsis cinerea okayama7\|eukprot:XP_001841068.2 hypothetical protein CC1G_04912 [Coprinopsis cinerea okayama7\